MSWLYLVICRLYRCELGIRVRTDDDSSRDRYSFVRQKVRERSPNLPPVVCLSAMKCNLLTTFPPLSRSVAGSSHVALIVTWHTNGCNFNYNPTTNFFIGYECVIWGM